MDAGRIREGRAGSAGGHMDPRVDGHTLRELWEMTAKCECGWETKIAAVDANGRKSANLRDELMDRHAYHLERVLRRRSGEQEPE